MLFTLSENNVPEIKNYYKKGDLYFSQQMFDEVDESYISETDLECCYIKFTQNESTVEFHPSHHYDFFVYQDEDTLLIASDINELVTSIKEDSLTPNRVAIASVLTFGQVPEGMTLFNQISSFKGPRYGSLCLRSRRLEIKTKLYEPDDRLFDKEYFKDYYTNKLTKIGNYSLFYSQGVDSEFIKACNPNVNTLSFEYTSEEGHKHLPLFETLNHIDVHSINFPGEYKAWSIGQGKVVTGFGGDSSFAISDIHHCSFDFFLRSSGGPGSWDELESTLEDENTKMIEGLTSKERTLLGKRKICGGDCSQNTIQWAWKKSNAYVHNVLSDPVVATTFNKVHKTYGDRFLLNYVSGRKNTNPFDTTYWNDFVAETYEHIFPTKVFYLQLADTETYYGKLKYLLELYFSIGERYYKVAL